MANDGAWLVTPQLAQQSGLIDGALAAALAEVGIAMKRSIVSNGPKLLLQ
jgi:hypothetical protein